MTAVPARLTASVTIVALGLLATGCGKRKGEAAGKIETITAGTLTVGSDIPYKPFEFGRAPSYRGFDVDIVKAVAKEINLKVKFKKRPFEAIFRDLTQGEIDIVVSATSITPERKRTISFSQPYFSANQSLTVKRGSPIKAVADLNGRIVGTQIGTTGADYARKQTNAKTVRTYDLSADAFNALQAGQVEAVINDFAVSQYATRSRSNLKVVEPIPTGERYGLAFAKKSNDLRQAVNDALSKIKEDGDYAKIYRKWFASDPPKGILN